MKQAALFDIEGQVAMVTGAGSGIGLAYAEVLAENGAKVLLTSKSEERLKEHTARLRRAGCDVDYAVLDIADTEKLRTTIDGLAEQHGRLDIVFANVGVSHGRGFLVDPNGSLTKIDFDAFRRVIEVNLTCNLLTIAHAARHMRAQKRGSIVVTSSVAGLVGEPIVSYGYAASKAALHNAVRQAALDFALDNVRVNVIAPGPFLTNIGGGRLHTNPEVAKIFADGVPMKRIAHTDEIKGIALLLASPAGSFITGAIIPVDGGSTAILPGRGT
jgi:NAD(P)-dependent dehydrogenase (short-subunit alcohol dehydrogenase family)